MKSPTHALRCFFAGILMLAAAAGLQAQSSAPFVLSTSSLSLSAQSGSTTPVMGQFNITSSSDTQVLFTVTPYGSWLSVNPSSGSTPATVTVFANPNGLAADNYLGAVAVTSGGTTSLVTVNFKVGNTSQLSAIPSTLAFTYQLGGQVPTNQTLTVSTSGPSVNYTVQTSATWLLVGGNGTAPGTLSVGLNPAGLSADTYQAVISLTPTSGSTTPFEVPVTLTVTASPPLNISPTSLAFNYQVGGTNIVVSKTLALSNSGAPVAFFVTNSTNWLTVNPTSGSTAGNNTPTNLTVSIQTAALPSPQTQPYEGTITISAPGSATPTQKITVSLRVSNNPLLDLTPNALTFTYQIGGTLPADQQIVPTSTGAALNLTISSTTNNTGNWLSAPASGATADPFPVSVNPVGLGVGTYNGSVTVTATGADNNPQVVPVVLKVTNVATLMPSPDRLVFNYQVGHATPAIQTVSVTSTNDSPTFTVSTKMDNTSNSLNWLLAGTPSGAATTTTPATFTVGVNPAGLPDGTYTGTVTLTSSTAANSPVTIPVTLNVSQSPLLNVSPTSLAFTYELGGDPQFRTISLSSTSDPLTYTVTWDANWLAVTPPGGTTDASPKLNVLVVPFSLTPGDYHAMITISAPNNPPQTVAVRLTVATGAIQVSSTSLSFSQPEGGASPPAQTVSVTGSGTGSLAFSAFASGGSWLSVSPNSGTTPGTLTIAVDGSGLKQGTYKGVVTVFSVGAANSPQSIGVELAVSASQSLALSTDSLSFNYQVGSAAPASQTFNVSSSGGGVNFLASGVAENGASWLTVAPASGTTPATLSVSVVPGSLSPGTYRGQVSVSSPQVNNSPQTVNVTLTVSVVPVPAPTAILNAASFVPGPLAPGEIISIFGSNLGSQTATSGTVDSSGILATTVADTRVLFDNNPAPILYVSSTQINVVVPYALYGRSSTHLQVEYKGVVSGSIDLKVADSAPGIFTLLPSTQGAIINETNTVNAADNPAPKGSVISIYATGEGQTTPAGVDGKIIPSEVNQLKKPLLPVKVTIGGQEADVTYAGSAPLFVSGALQVNVRIPENAPSGAALPVVLTIGGNSSMGVATVAIQ